MCLVPANFRELLLVSYNKHNPSTRPGGGSETGDARLFSPSTARNRAPIFEVLSEVFPARGRVLEIASGSGEHGAFVVPLMPEIVWQPSDLDGRARQSISAWRSHSNEDRLREPIELDVSQDGWWEDPLVTGIAPVDAVININMIHISPWRACEGLMAGAGNVLSKDGVLYLYGPFQNDGQMVDSNVAFDASLRARDPAWGVRDLEDVVSLAERHGLKLDRIVEMPANNLSVVFRRLRDGSA